MFSKRHSAADFCNTVLFLFTWSYRITTNLLNCSVERFPSYTLFAICLYWGKELFLDRFPQLRSYRNDIGNTEPGRYSLHFTNSSRRFFSCRSTIDIPPKHRTFMYSDQAKSLMEDLLLTLSISLVAPLARFAVKIENDIYQSSYSYKS